MFAPGVIRALTHVDIGSPPAAIVLIPAVIAGWIVAERHSPSR
jgi:hypothetical protein